MSVKKGLKKIREKLRSRWYRYWYDKGRLDEYAVLLDSKNGKDLGSNMLRIGEELLQNPDYENYTIYFSCNDNKRSQFRRMLSACSSDRIRFVKEAGFQHYKLLSSAKYVFTDTSFPLEYVKQKGQTVVNTWHGTPLKKMGRHDPQLSYAMGNVQKSQLQADYLVYPSEYMKDIMFSAYCLEHLYKGSVLYCGYPRNSVFFRKEKGEALRKKLCMEGKRIYAYMPTWRGNLVNIRVTEQIEQVQEDLKKIDEMLADDEVCLLRLHPFVSASFDYSGYTHIYPFPAAEEPYEVLNMADCLITDYSSVFYDFANTGKKIVLYIYDREQYMDERGVYMKVNDLPFPIAGTPEELIIQLRSPKGYDDRGFRKLYCTYDAPDSAENLCAHILKGKSIFQDVYNVSNGKKNILIYAGDLGDDEVTRMLIQCVEHRDFGDANYAVAFWSPYLHGNPGRVEKIPDWAGMIPMTGLSDGRDSGWSGYRRYFGEMEFEQIICCPEPRRDIRAIFENLPGSNAVFLETAEDVRGLLRHGAVEGNYTE